MSKATKVINSNEQEDLSILQQNKLLCHQLTVKENEIYELKNYLDSYKKENLTLEKKNKTLVENLNISLQNDVKIKSLSDKIEFLNSENHRLQEEIKSNQNLFKDEKLTLKKEFEDYIHKEKQNAELMRNKFDNVFNLEKEKEKQSNTIRELEEKILLKDIYYLDKIDQKKFKNSMKFFNLKQIMMEDVKKSQKNVDKLNLDQIDISSKLTLLQNHQLLLEIESQNQRCEELSRRNEILEKQTFEMKNEIDLNNQIKIEIVKKNKDYKNKIKELTQNISKLMVNDKDIINNTNGSLLKSKLATRNRNSDEKNDSLKNSNSQSNEFSLNYTKTGEYTTNYIDDRTISYTKFTDLEKRYEKKIKDYEILNLNYDSSKERLSNLEKNFRQVIALIENGLQVLSEDERIRTKKELMLDLTNVKDCNFEDLSKERKYSLLCILLKNFTSILNVEILGMSDRGKIMNPYYNEIKLNFSKNSSYKENQLLKQTLLTSVRSPNSFFSITKNGLKIDLPKIHQRNDNSLGVLKNYFQTK